MGEKREKSAFGGDNKFGVTEEKSSRKSVAPINIESKGASLFSQPTTSEAPKMKTQPFGGASMFDKKDDQKPKEKNPEETAGGLFGAAKKPTNPGSNLFGVKSP